MSKPSINHYEQKLENKAARRSAKGRPKMAVSGAGVKQLVRIIKEKKVK